MKKLFTFIMVAALAIIGISTEGSKFLGFRSATTPATPSMEQVTGACTPEPATPCPPREPEILMPHAPPAPVVTVPPEAIDEPKICPHTPPAIVEDAAPPKPSRIPPKLRKLGCNTQSTE